MDSLHLDISPAHLAFLDEQVAQGGYSDVGADVAKLIDTDARLRAQEKLEALLLEGLEGEVTEWTQADTERLKRLARTGLVDW